MPYGEDVVADPTVIFGGAMNYRHYLGTVDLPQEFNDRSLIVEVTYPPLALEDGKQSHYEAQIVAQYIDELAGLRPQEFVRAWNHVINGVTDPEIGKVLNIAREKRIKDVHYIVKVANRIRQAYSAYQSGECPDLEVNLVFSMRGAEWIASAVGLGADVKDAAREIILAKGHNKEEKRNLKTILEHVDRPER